MNLTTILEYLIPAFSGITAAYFGYRFGRWGGLKEQIFAKKIDSYKDFVIQYFEFMKECTPVPNLTVKQYTAALDAYSKLLIQFYQASLFMPRRLHDDIHTRLDPTTEQLMKVAKFWQILLNIQKKKKIDIPFEQLKRDIIAGAELMVELPGPFEKVINSFQDIIEMLRKDLGVYKLDSKFYNP